MFIQSPDVTASRERGAVCRDARDLWWAVSEAADAACACGGVSGPVSVHVSMIGALTATHVYCSCTHHNRAAVSNVLTSARRPPPTVQ